MSEYAPEPVDVPDAPAEQPAEDTPEAVPVEEPAADE